MKTEQDAIQLAQSMVAVASGLGIKCQAQITSMDNPIGSHIGNSLEVIESIEVLQGKGHQDTRNLVIMQASALLLLSNIVENTAQGDAMVSQVLDDGSALNKFEKMCIGQGVSIETASRLCKNPSDVLPLSNTKIEMISTKTGFVSSIDSLNVADIARKHGAGRFDIEDIIVPEVGFIITKNVGEKIDSGQCWMEFYYTTEPTDEEIALLNSSITVSQHQNPPQPRLITVVEEPSDK